MPRQYIRVPLVTRFWAKVEKTPGCWLWRGVLNIRGYGQIGAGGRPDRKLLAHRISWELAYGPIPRGLFALHRCDVRACVRPDHLFLGTRSDNAHDMWDKGRARPQGVSRLRRAE